MDHNSKKYKWKNKFTSEELEKFFPDLGGLNSIQIIDKSNTGRVLKVRLHGTKGNKIISGKNIRKRLKLLSTKFKVYLKFDPVSLYDKFNLYNKIVDDFSPQTLPPIPSIYFLLVEGYGAGHGVGMSQWGAKSMAEKGSSFREILKHYYTGVQIKKY
tara:strand:+ start:771 stop:1241 length:471 start_codon:yes stop_codon:yes gene_type:complete